MTYVTLGKDTVYSVAVILKAIERTDICELDSALLRFDYVDDNYDLIYDYFLCRFQPDVDMDRIRLVFNHGIDEINRKGWPL